MKPESQMRRLANRVRSAVRDVTGTCVRAGWRRVCKAGTIGPFDSAGRRFGHFGFGSAICFPAATIVNERHIAIGAGTLICPHVALSVGMFPGQPGLAETVLRIGDRCVLGRGSSSIAHTSVEIGAGSWLGYGAVVLPGARIGRNAVIGANAVVTGEIPDFSVAVGVPARVVKRHAVGEGWRRVA